MRKAFKVQFPEACNKQTEDEDEIMDGELGDDEDTDDEAIWAGLAESDQEALEDVLAMNSKTRLSCFAHSLQLVIGDGLKKLQGSGVGDVLTKAHRLSATLHRSTIFKER